MLPALPAFDLDPFQGSPFPALDWDGPDLLGCKPTSVTSSSGSDDPNGPPEKPASEESKCVASERKRRRMISNRESARRSRMRKQRHLENLRNQVNLFRVENRELKNALHFLLHHFNLLRTQNDCLRSERTLLRQKLDNINQFLLLQQLQPFSSAWLTE
ncbi:hypothetical protein Fmac_002292 [Flemingia macrophylla]|uniref:BZIP domain-containing protein n=1 Tax=Flemingia macrophylla TaxID=520843 RepID=A0ABD1NJI6_9FABA